MPTWVVWTGFWFTVLGAVLTGVAFFFTFREAREAKRAAQAAKDAANEAKEAVSERATIADLTGISSSFTAIMMWLEGGKLELAAYEIRLVRQRVNGLRERRGFEQHRDHLNKLIATLADLQQTIERKRFSEPDMALPLAEISAVLAAHSDQLAAWGEQIRFD